MVVMLVWLRGREKRDRLATIRSGCVWALHGRDTLREGATGNGQQVASLHLASRTHDITTLNAGQPSRSNSSITLIISNKGEGEGKKGGCVKDKDRPGLSWSVAEQ